MWEFLLYISPIHFSRRRTEARRKYFYEAILEICSDESDVAAQLMGQSIFDVKADKDSATIDTAKGIMIFTVPAVFYGLECHHTYSLWQIGDMLKVGVLFTNGLEQAPILDLHREIGELWHGTPYHTIGKADSTMYEWSFKVPRLYDSWSEQEFYVCGMNHFRQRILRIVHDYALLKQEN